MKVKWSQPKLIEVSVPMAGIIGTGDSKKCIQTANQVVAKIIAQQKSGKN